MSRTQFIRAFVFVLLLGLTLSLPARAAATNEQPQAKADLVVMSFNIRYAAANDGENNWDKRKDLACEVLRRHKPDLIGLAGGPSRRRSTTSGRPCRNMARSASAGRMARPRASIPPFSIARTASM